MKTTILSIFTFLIFLQLQAQNTINISPDKDNTMYSEDGGVSNGAGDYLFFGRTNNGDLRRALVSFDIASQLQPGDSIIDVSLKIEVSKTPNSISYTVNAHTVNMNWGEGTSDAPSQEGQGTTATNGDATWTHAIFGTAAPILWNTTGGDFNPVSSGSTDITSNGSYSITGAQLTADVQTWLDTPGVNNGWILIGDEITNASAKRINSRENSLNPIVLEVTYISPVSSLKTYESLSDARVLPNPVRNTFVLENSKGIEKLEILDLSGKTRLILDANRKSHDIASLERGIYLLKMSSGDKTVTKKLIKQ